MVHDGVEIDSDWQEERELVSQSPHLKKHVTLFLTRLSKLCIPVGYNHSVRVDLSGTPRSRRVSIGAVVVLHILIGKREDTGVSGPSGARVWYSCKQTIDSIR